MNLLRRRKQEPESAPVVAQESPRPDTGWLNEAHTFHKVHVFGEWLSAYEIAVFAGISAVQAWRDIMSEPHGDGKRIYRIDAVRLYFPEDYDEFSLIEHEAQEALELMGQQPEARRVSGWDKHKGYPGQRVEWDETLRRPVLVYRMG